MHEMPIIWRVHQLGSQTGQDIFTGSPHCLKNLVFSMTSTPWQRNDWFPRIYLWVRHYPYPAQNRAFGCMRKATLLNQWSFKDLKGPLVLFRGGGDSANWRRNGAGISNEIGSCGTTLNLQNIWQGKVMYFWIGCMMAMVWAQNAASACKFTTIGVITIVNRLLDKRNTTGAPLQHVVPWALRTWYTIQGRAEYVKS